MSDEGGLRERKKLATRTALTDSALRLSVEHGVESITVEQIAVDAGVSLRTFFNYFSSKEEAVVAGDAVTAGRIVSAFAGRPAEESVVEALQRALAETVPELVDRERMAELRVLRSTPSLLPHQLAAFGAHEQGLAKAVASRLGTDLDEDPYPLLVAATVLAALRITVQRWLDAPETPGRAALRDLIKVAIAQLAEGFGTRRPR
jgi:AcrR family transcriptional regulator